MFRLPAPKFSFRCRILLLCLLAASGLLRSVEAQTQLQFTHLVDSDTARPDGGNFTGNLALDYSNPLGYTMPVTDGKTVAFNVGLYPSASCSSTSENSMWTIPIGGGALTKVAGYGLNLEAAQPLMSPTTTCFMPKIGNGTLFFYGSYSTGASTTRDGVYQVPLTGGPSSSAIVVGDNFAGVTLPVVSNSINTAPDGIVSTTGGGFGSADTSYDALFRGSAGPYAITVGGDPPADCNPTAPANTGWQFSTSQTPILFDGTNYVTYTRSSGITADGGSASAADQYIVLSSSSPASFVDCSNVVWNIALRTPAGAVVPLPGIPGTAAGEFSVQSMDVDSGRIFLSALQGFSGPYAPAGYHAIYQLVGGQLVKIVSSLDTIPGVTFDTTQCSGAYASYPEQPTLGQAFTVRGNWLITAVLGDTSFNCTTGTSTEWIGIIAVNLTTHAIEKIVANNDVLDNGQTTVVGPNWGVAGESVLGSLASDGHFTFLATTTTTSKTLGSGYVIFSTNLNALPTTTTLTAMPSAQGYFQNVTLSATVTTQPPSGVTPNGSVQFLDGTTPLGPAATLDATGKASMTLDSLTVGAHSITVAYAGMDPYLPSTSAAAGVTITQGMTALALMTSNPKVPASTPVTFTAQLSVTSAGGVPTGNVTFLDGGATIGVMSVDSAGVASIQLSPTVLGVHTITASYGGDPNFTGSTAPSISETITSPLSTPSMTVILEPGVSFVYGTTATVSVTISPPQGTTSIPSGTVTGTVDGAQVLSGMLSGGAVVMNLGVLNAGTHTVIVNYGGDPNFTAATQSSQLTVLKAPLTVSAGSGTRSYGSLNPAFTATITGLENGDAITATASSAATITSPIGTYPVTTVLADTNSRLGNYNLTQIAGALMVTSVPITVTMNSITAVYGQSVPPPSANISGILAQDAGNGNVTVTIGIAATSSSPVGTYVIPVTLSGPAANNYTLLIPGNPAVTIGLAPLTVKAASLARTYGSANPTLTGTVTGTVNNDSLTATYATSATSSSGVGTYPITATVTGPKIANYMVQVTNGSLTIAAEPLTVQPNNVSRMFGVANPTLNGTLTGVVNNDSLTVTYSTTATTTSAVGTFPITASVSGANVSDYAVQPTSGTLTVTQAGSATVLTLSSQSAAMGQSLMLTAKATSTTSGTPTGVVTFFDGTTILGTGTLNPQGSTTIMISTLALGTHLLSANYAGDQNFIPSQSTSSVETIGTPDYTISATPPSVTIVAGQSAQFTFLLTSLFGYSQPVALSCTNLPVGAACIFSPSSVTPTATGASASLTITTTATSAALSPLKLWEGGTGTVLACCLLFVARKRWLTLRLTVLLVLICGIGLSGCGGGNSNSPTESATPTPAGTDAITVSATAGSGGSSHAAQVTVIVTP